MKRAIIMSAKYAPGHFSHMLAYSKLFESAGYTSIMLINEEDKGFKNDYIEYKYESFNNIDSLSADILLIYNMSVNDKKYMEILKGNNRNLKVLFVYHEPWFGYKKWFNDFISRKESLMDSIKTLGRFFFVISLLKKADRILLPSNKAIEYYRKICVKYNRNYTFFPLVFTDEADNKINMKEKKYFSFISTVQNSKNFTMFLDYIKFKAKSDQYSIFQIATRSDVTEYIDDELKELVKQKRLIVNHKHSLSNKEINQAYAISNCTWLLYNRSTQSGVLCKSLMFGTPVIASNTGSFSEVVNRNNGIILKDNYTLEDVDRAYERIRCNYRTLCVGARNTFLNKFYWRNYTSDFKAILN